MLYAYCFMSTENLQETIHFLHLFSFVSMNFSFYPYWLKYIVKLFNYKIYKLTNIFKFIHNIHSGVHGGKCPLDGKCPEQKFLNTIWEMSTWVGSVHILGHYFTNFFTLISENFLKSLGSVPNFGNCPSGREVSIFSDAKWTN